MPPYKDKEKEKIARKASIERRIIGRVLLEFRKGDESIMNALNTVTHGSNRNAYLKAALIEKLKKDGYLNDNDEAP